jgi:polyvinyl alcohol dehydrogenase (cytochrome)
LAAAGLAATLAMWASVASAQPPGAGGPSPVAQGEAVFKARCASCHEPHIERAPSRTDLANYFSETVKKALTRGVMKDMAAGLSEADIDNVSWYLTGKQIRPVGDLSKEDQNRCPASDRFSAAGPSWNGFSPDLVQSREQKNGGISASDVPQLKVKWAFAIEGGRYGQPTIFGNRLYVVSSSGRAYALNAKTGCVAWSYTSEFGMRTAPVVSKNRAAPSGYAVYFGDYDKVVYAADAGSGKILWKLKVDPLPRAVLTGGFVSNAGILYVPLSTWEEAAATNGTYECCRGRGAVIAIDEATGKQRWKTYTIAEEAKPYKKNAAGAQMWGPAGAAIWAPPTLDLKRGLIYVATGDSYTDVEDGDASDAVMAMDLKTGVIRWKHQMTGDDNFISACGPTRRSENCPTKVGPDVDFGAAPILKTVGGKDVLLAGQKSGVVWGLDPTDGKILWNRKVSLGSAGGGVIWGMAADDANVYAAAADRQGGLNALDIVTGDLRWSVKLDPQPKCGWQGRCSGGYGSPPTVIPGVVFAGASDGHLRAFDVKSGQKVWDFDTGGQTYKTINGVDKQRGGPIESYGPTIANGHLYIISGYNGAGGGGWSDNVLLAFTKDGK